jgi:hypothetical protein
MPEISRDRMFYPAFLFAASPGYMYPVAFSFDCLYTGSLLESIADFTFRLEVDGMGFVEEDVFQSNATNFFPTILEVNPGRSYQQ